MQEAKLILHFILFHNNFCIFQTLHQMHLLRLFKIQIDLNSPYFIFITFSWCVCVYVCVIQRTTSGNWLFTSIMWVLGTQLSHQAWGQAQLPNKTSAFSFHIFNTFLKKTVLL